MGLICPCVWCGVYCFRIRAFLSSEGFGLCLLVGKDFELLSCTCYSVGAADLLSSLKV